MRSPDRLRVGRNEGRLRATLLSPLPPRRRSFLSVGLAVVFASAVFVLGTGRVAFAQTPRAFPDTTGRIGIFNDQITGLGGLTEAQVRFAATHYVGTQKMTRRDADRLRAIRPEFLILHYRLGISLGYRAPDTSCRPTGGFISVIDGDWVTEWPGDAAVKDDWFYKYGGQRVFNCDWGWYLMDTDNAAWRQAWLEAVLRQLEANDDDGLFADSVSVPNGFGADRYTPPLPPIDIPWEEGWSRRIERWLTLVRSTFAGRYRLIPNAGGWVTTRDTTDYSAADGVMIEGFSRWGPGSAFAPADWKLQMNRILGLERQNKIIIAQSYLGAAADIESRTFYLANYLLIKGAQTYLNMELSSAPEWFPEYELPLGRYTEPIPGAVDDLFRAPWGVYARRYVNGLALVNPGSTTRTVPLDRLYRIVTPAGGGIVPADGDISSWRVNLAPVTSVTLGPNRAAVLLVSGASGDLSGDGRADILWRRTNGEDAIWTMNGPAVVSASPLPPVADARWQIGATADFDGDGSPDILWRNTATGENVLWLMNGSSVTSAPSLPPVFDPGWQIRAAADFDGDGRSDILWRHAVTGENTIWLMSGATSVKSAVPLPPVADTAWQIFGAADFNGDGGPDLLWRHGTTGANTIWVMNGTAPATPAAAAAMPPVSDRGWEIGGVADFTGDGRPDILWRHAATGENTIWQMNGTSVVGAIALPPVSDLSWRMSGPR